MAEGGIMSILIGLTAVLIAWRWGDWRNWKQYYPTYLFMTTVSFITDSLTHRHTLWYFCPTLFLPNNTVTAMFYAFTVYPATVILFLSRYPAGQYWRQGLYIAQWVAVYSALEAMAKTLGAMGHQNGWTIWWSALVDITMFTALRIHFFKPLLAWLVAILFAALILTVFNFSLGDLK